MFISQVEEQRQHGELLRLTLYSIL